MDMGFAWGGASLHCLTSTSTVPRAAPDALKALRSPCTCDNTALGTRKRGAERCGVHLPRFFQIRGGEGGGGKRKQTHPPCYPFPPWCFFQAPTPEVAVATRCALGRGSGTGSRTHRHNTGLCSLRPAPPKGSHESNAPGSVCGSPLQHHLPLIRSEFHSEPRAKLFVSK